MFLLQHLMSSTPSTSKASKQRKGGLNGGSNENTPVKQLLICNVESKSNDAVWVECLNSLSDAPVNLSLFLTWNKVT